MKLTPAQKKALDWLNERNGSGVLDKYGRLLAAGETAPFMNATYMRLAMLGLVKIEGGRVSVSS